MKNNIFFISASDRFNYGDVLFPLIFSQKCNQNSVKFHNVGLVSSDLSDKGGIKTISFRKMEKLIANNDKVILGGGELLYPNWHILLTYIYKIYFLMSKLSLLNRVLIKFNVANKILSKNNVKYPFSFDANDFKLNNLNVYYSSVGGNITKNTKDINNKLDKLNKAKLVSFRDNRAYNSFYNFGVINAKLVPDSAIIMSDFYSKDNLKDLLPNNLKNLKYISVQFGLGKQPQDLLSFCKILDNYAELNKFKVVLTPIGLTYGHDDLVILNKMKDLFPNFILSNPKTVFDIMSIISHAQMYIGTSLHGAITALSYNVIPIGYNSNITKLESYLKTWVCDEYFNLDEETFNEKNLNHLINLFQSSYSIDKLQDQKLKVHQNLETIINDQVC
nr:polysaccharide pyruvyl transferase family protein [uncultured Flavobacterium sp.]